MKFLSDGMKVVFTFTLLHLLLVVNLFRKVKVNIIIGNSFGNAIDVLLWTIYSRESGDDRHTLNLYFRTGTIVNDYLREQYKKHGIPVPPLNIGTHIRWNMLKFPYLNKIIGIYASANNSPEFFNDKRSFLQITSQERREGDARMEGLHVGAEDKIVCFANRDSGFHSELFESYRNNDVNSYISALQLLEEQGYACIRMGRKNASALHHTSPRIIDYGSSPVASDFLDFYLIQRSAFLICPSNGLYMLSLAYKKPTLYVSLCPFDIIEAVVIYAPSNSVILPKLLLQTENHKLLSFRKTSSIAPIDHKSFADSYVPVDNSTDEVRDATLQILATLDGNYAPTPDQEERQRTFWRTFFPHLEERVFTYNIRISDAFLQKHKGLL